jgi:hypothetical protein
MSITGRIVRGLVRRRVSERDVMGPVQVEVLEIIESRRIAEPIGDDPPVQCDNRKSSSEKTFTFRASRTWRREYVIQTENMRTEGSSTGGLFRDAGCYAKFISPRDVSPQKNGLSTKGLSYHT